MRKLVLMAVFALFVTIWMSLVIRSEAAKSVSQAPAISTIVHLGHDSNTMFNVGSPLPPSQERYVATPLDLFPGGTFAAITKMNNLGQAVGQSDQNGSFAVLWRNGPITNLGVLGPSEGGDSWSQAEAINDSGQIVGSSSTLRGVRPFLWQNGSMTSLGTLPGYDGRESSATALGINNLGQIIGYSRPGSRIFETPTGWLWQNGVFTTLGSLPGYNSVYPLDINDLGQITGYVDIFYSSTPRAFIWQNGTMTDLGSLGGSWTRAIAINNSGQVVGVSITPDGFGHAFLWQNGVMADLNVPGEATQAVGINNTGQIIGTSQTNGNNHPFVITNGVISDLTTLVPSDVTPNWPTDINDAGQIFTTAWVMIDGRLRNRPYLLTPCSMVPMAPPTISASDIMVVATGPNGASVDFSATATSADGRPATVSYSIPSGSMLPIGTTVVTVTATDFCGNTSSSAFTVTVNRRVPTNTDECKNGGWQTLQRANGTLFTNQGDCVSYVNTGH